MDSFQHFAFYELGTNLFLRELDMMNVDLRLKEDAVAAKKKATKSKRRKKRKKPIPDEEEDSGFHFVAYVPARGHVWRMDGMEKQPKSLGEYLRIRSMTVVSLLYQGQYKTERIGSHQCFRTFKRNGPTMMQMR